MGLNSQLRRAASSIPANIVEGSSRNYTKEYMQFFFQARGSLEEVRYFILLSKVLTYLQKTTYRHHKNTCENVSKMLSGLFTSLKRKIKS